MSGTSRRRFALALAGVAGRPAIGPAWPGPGESADAAGGGGGAPDGAGGLTDVSGLRVGHFTDPRRPTGCTVVLAEPAAVCGVDVRGGAPGTRETDLLDPVNSVQAVDAVLLTGGSAFGLDAATGVVRYVEEKGLGFPVGVGRVPIVPAAVLFDLAVGDWTIRPDARAGYEAARAASRGPVAEGSVGAGAGATVGKLFGVAGAMKGGLGTASVRRPDGVVVAALVAVNAVGDVVDPDTGRVLAGARRGDGKDLRGTVAALAAGATPGRPLSGQNTCIGVVATNVRLTKTEATKVAQMAHDGLARAVRPVHTPWDGDTLFALSTGAVDAAEAVMLVGALAAEVVSRAVVRGVRAAKGLPSYPSASDLAGR
jgi:L-aminopeptidase/D-esterase-like protein